MEIVGFIVDGLMLIGEVKGKLQKDGGSFYKVVNVMLLNVAYSRLSMGYFLVPFVADEVFIPCEAISFKPAQKIIELYLQERAKLSGIEIGLVTDLEGKKNAGG